MPFRARIKRVLGRSSSSSTSSDSTSSTPSAPGLDHRKDSSVYKPGEPMPRPKYRAPVDKKHKEMLDSFDFVNRWRNPSSRRGSHDWSLYSPHGSRIPSRTNSFSAIKPKFMRGKSSVGAKVVENEDEVEDLANVGMSRGHSRRASRDLNRDAIPGKIAPHSTHSSQHNKHASGNLLHHVGDIPVHTKTSAGATAAAATEPSGEGAEGVQGRDDGSVLTGRKHASSTATAHDHTPFSQEEIEQALKKVPTFPEEDEDGDYAHVKPTTL